MDIIHVLGLAAGFLNVFGFWFYNREVFVGKTCPPAASWFLWSIVTVVNLGSYHAMKVDWAIITTMVSDTTMCVATFAFFLIKGKFGKLSKEDCGVVALCLVAIVLWKSVSAQEGNLMAQVPMVLSFLPILRDTKSGKTIENPWAWVIFTVSFLMTFTVVCCTWTHRMDFVYPIVAITMHGFQTYYSFRGRRLYSSPGVLRSPRAVN